MVDQSAQPAPLDEARKIKAESEKKEIHKEALNRFKSIVAREEHSRHMSIGDRIFVDQDGGTWDDSTGFLSGRDLTRENVGTSAEPPAPRYEIDLISPVIEQAVSDQREAEISIKVRGVGEADKGLADVYNGLIKNIEITSDASDAYDGGFDEVQKGGYGGWEIVTEFSDDSFEQDIRIVPIQSATESLFFGPAKMATKEDALYAFKLWNIDIEEFKVQFPKAIDQAEWPQELRSNHIWFPSRDKLLRVAAYWRKRLVTREIVQLEDGRILQEEDFFEGMPVAVRNGEEKRRSVKTYEVERFILNGIQVLKGPQRWAGKFIPLIPEFGIRSVINDQEIVRGRVRKGRDSQQIYNYTTSAIVEAAALAGKDITWMTPAQMKGHVEELSKMHVSGNPIQQYNPDAEAPGPPIKNPGPVVQQALIDQRQAAKEDVGLSVGAGVGTLDGTAADPRSGEAIKAGNVTREKGNSIYNTNHERAIKYTGLQLADLISKLWTTQQQRRIIKPDGEEDFVTVNETRMVDGKETIINDLAQTTFDVVLDIGPT
ncbi:MAG: hypothetical protein IIB77_14175 [Proteobacteria bacterium]|nr:hypothetical protein [Pseudomonadota bacterium]